MERVIEQNENESMYLIDGKIIYLRTHYDNLNQFSDLVINLIKLNCLNTPFWFAKQREMMYSFGDG